MAKTQFDRVLDAAGFTEYHRDKLQTYYNDALEYIKNAGVPESVATSEKADGCIVRYVLDTYNLNSNNVTLSDFFFMRLKQLQTLEVYPNEEDTES